MIRGWISVGVLFVVVMALALWVAYRPRTADVEAHAISALTPSQVTRIRFERTAPSGAPGHGGTSDPKQIGATFAVLERRTDGWRVIEPVRARADSFHVERLLALLDERSLARYPVRDLGRYGLDQPVARLTLNDEAFSFGAVNAMTREQYVLARDGVYAIPLSQRTALPREATSLISRTLFAPGETPVRLQLENFTASLEDGRWIFNAPGEEPGPDERNAWVAAWRQANAVEARPYDGRRPLASVEVVLQDGRRIRLGVLEREPEFVLVRDDENIEYHFLADVGRRLLRPPASGGSERPLNARTT
jgi:hypothetical protein